MSYIIKHMDENILNEIISWKYEGKYSEYNMQSYEQLKERNASIINPQKRENYLCYFKNKELIGYTNTVQKGNGDIFLGIGLAPKHCSRGLGSEILLDSINKVIKKFPNSKIKLQVRSWNERAIKCYEKAGFKYIKKDTAIDYVGNNEEFVFMEYEM